MTVREEKYYKQQLCEYFIKNIGFAPKYTDITIIHVEQLIGGHIITALLGKYYYQLDFNGSRYIIRKAQSLEGLLK